MNLAGNVLTRLSLWLEHERIFSAACYHESTQIGAYHHYKVVSYHIAHGEVYSVQHYVIKFVRDLRQIGGFLRLLRFPPAIKNVDIKFSAHDAFLEKPSSGTLKIEILESQII